MRKVKLFFLLTALLAIAQGAWAATKTFTSFKNGNNTQSPVTMNCSLGYVDNGIIVLNSNWNMTISVSAGYTITEVKLTVYGTLNFFGSSSYPPITATYGTLSNNRPGTGATVTVSNVNNTQTVLQTNGDYAFSQVQVTYTPVNYTITYNLGGGSISGSYPTSYNIETNTFTLKNPTRSGYTFTGWTGSNGSTKQTSVSITKGSTGNKSYTANWQANTYTVYFNKQNGTGGSNSVTATYDSAMPNMTRPTRTGYTFGGYYTGTGGSGTQYYYAGGGSVRSWDKTSNTTLYAKWSVVNYTISYTLNGGTISGSYPTSYNVETNTFTLKNPTRSGYAFAGWTGSNGSTPQTSVSIAKGSTGNKNYTANWISQAAVDVMNLINAIGTPITLDSKDAIDAARAAYNALTNAQKTEVTNYGTLTNAEAALAVVNLINAIGSPITAASQTAIDAARNAYDNLTDDQKALVGNLSTLTNAEAALAVVNLINAIDDPVVYTTACHDEITDARTAYEALTAEQKALVDATTLQVLTDAEAAYAALEADHNAANAVIDLINAIDNPVVYTDACHQEILDAREAYNNLTQAQKDLIDASTLQKLTDAEDAYASLDVDITAKLDPQNAGVYYSTFYDGSRQMQLPADVEAYTATVSGDKMLLKKVAVPGDILPAATAVVLRAPQEDVTLTPSAASPVSVENNALLGTDVNMNVPSDHCYVLSGADGFVGFYPLSGSYTLTAHKAYIDLDNLPGGANNAPRRLRFVFSEEQTATGMENVQNEETKAQKVMIDGVMYIIRGEHMYDAQGQIVK